MKPQDDLLSDDEMVAHRVYQAAYAALHVASVSDAIEHHAKVNKLSLMPGDSVHLGVGILESIEATCHSRALIACKAYLWRASTAAARVEEARPGDHYICSMKLVGAAHQKYATWWMADGMGLTNLLSEAGVFEAGDERGTGSGELHVPVSIARSLICDHVMWGDIRRKLGIPRG